MKNGCPQCAKLPDNKMCDVCELGLLEATAEAAMRNYTDKVNQIMQGKEHDHCGNQEHSSL